MWCETQEALDESVGAHESAAAKLDARARAPAWPTGKRSTRLKERSVSCEDTLECGQNLETPSSRLSSTGLLLSQINYRSLTQIAFFLAED